MRISFLTVFLCAVFFIASAKSRTISGKVVRVSDGDSIHIQTRSGKKYEVRLYGVDSPEMGQAFGRSARKYTSRLVNKKKVSVTVYDIDQYGRTVGVVTSAGTNVNEYLVASGLAWQYGRYCHVSFCSQWKRLEQQARAQKKGLWKKTDPIPPWEWRKKHQKNKNQKGLTGQWR